MAHPASREKMAMEIGVALFDQLKRDLTYLDDDKIAQIYEAYQVASEAHSGQKRHSGEDYITHPVAVARILARMRMDYQSIMVALMHDVLEDTPVEKQGLAKQFDPVIAELVDGVSKLTQIQFETRAEAQAHNFRKMLLAMVKDIRVIIIKLADRLHNMRTLGVCPPAKRRRIAIETLEIYAPIANRLGMHNIFIELEDLGFAALHPMRHRILKQSVLRARGNRKEITSEIENDLTAHLQKSSVEFVKIQGREKHLYSIYRKMRDKRIPFAEIMDVYAFRIVVKDTDTCYRVLGVVHNLYKPVPERFKDYIAIPKINSYQSLHTTLFGPYGVPIEVQIRTQEMNQVADSGIAAHWFYKAKGSAMPVKAQARAREWLKGLIEMQESTKSPTEFLENVKIDLFPDEVYVFTPKGDIMEMPSGATAVDFAYSVHSDIGNSCIAAKINRRLAPLSTVLVNGQTVEIITAPGARPNPAWLNFVNTSKARSNIRHYLKGQRRAEAVEMGEKLLVRALANLSLSDADIQPDNQEQVLAELKLKTMNDLYEAIGLGMQLPIVIARKLTADKADASLLEKQMPGETEAPLLIKGSAGMIVKFGDCCRPIPGDPIIGVFNPGHGLVVHMAQCRKISRLCAIPDKCIDMQWEDNIVGEFKVDIRVEVANQRGVLAKLASTIASADANIDDIRVDSHEGRFNIIDLRLEVNNRAHLARIMRRIREVKVVTRLSRLK